MKISERKSKVAPKNFVSKNKPLEEIKDGKKRWKT
jgi:hypothetical protein